MPDDQTEFTRRRLLAAGGAGAASRSDASRAFGQQAHGTPLAGDFLLPDLPGEKLRWAIVGLGNFAVGEAIPGFIDSQHARMTAFVSGSPAKQKDLGARYGVSRFYNYANFDSIAHDPEIDCVYIILPVGLHAEYTIRALKAGKHVLCEKPMASTSAECEAMIAAAKAAKRQLGVAYRVHFEPTNVRARQLIDGGEIGDIRFVSADHGFNADPELRPAQVAAAKGARRRRLDVRHRHLRAQHLADDAWPRTRSSFRPATSIPRTIRASARSRAGSNTACGWPNGVSVAGSSSYSWSPYISQQRYMGSKATSLHEAGDDLRPQHHHRRRQRPNREIGAGNPLTQFQNQIDAFSLAARANTPHKTPGEMGLRDIRLIEAMYTQRRQRRGDREAVKRWVAVVALVAGSAAGARAIARRTSTRAERTRFGFGELRAGADGDQIGRAPPTSTRPKSAAYTPPAAVQPRRPIARPARLAQAAGRTGAADRGRLDRPCTRRWSGPSRDRLAQGQPMGEDRVSTRNTGPDRSSRRTAARARTSMHDHLSESATCKVPALIFYTYVWPRRAHAEFRPAASRPTQGASLEHGFAYVEYRPQMPAGGQRRDDEGWGDRPGPLAAREDATGARCARGLGAPASLRAEMASDPRIHGKPHLADRPFALRQGRTRRRRIRSGIRRRARVEFRRGRRQDHAARFRRAMGEPRRLGRIPLADAERHVLRAERSLDLRPSRSTRTR